MASVKDGIDLVSRYSGLGDLTEAMGNAWYGINHRGVGNPIPYNTDNHGLTFFTRPRLNLSYDNIAMDRVLTPLLTKDVNTYQRAVRVLLDPVGAASIRDPMVFGSQQPVTSPLVDHRSPFMAVLTNNLLSLNGWPDPVVAYYNSKQGPAKETWSMVDDVARNFDSFDLQASFRNVAGDPITLLFNSWIRYAARVYDGTMMPYPDSVVENEIDYQTRIYRLVLDPSRRFVQKIAATGAAFPTSSALGAAFNFTSDTPFNQDNAQQISIPFHCMGVDYNDPILIKEFNDIVSFFNTDMLDTNRYKRMIQLGASDNDRLIKIGVPAEYVERFRAVERSLFNYRGVPYIHPLTLELQWWVYADDYGDFVGRLRNHLKDPGFNLDSRYIDGTTSP